MSSSSIADGSKQGWRAPILAKFTPEVAQATRITVVSDPDALLTEQTLLDTLRERGFELIPFDDEVAFRYAYESRFRSLWDRGDSTNLVVVLRSERHDLSGVPFDLLEQARRDERCLRFAIGDIFPHLVPRVVAELDRADLDALHDAQESQNPGPLGENATQDFVLRHVFEVAPELIKTPADLLRMLLSRHYRRRLVPISLDERLIQLLCRSERWADWPLSAIVPRREAFLEFLEERWSAFVRVAARSPATGVSEDAPAVELRYPGPIDLPFDHHDVRAYMDNLFVEGSLTPTSVTTRSRLSESWMHVGVTDAGDDSVDSLRSERLYQRLRDEIPDVTCDHAEWGEYGRRWAEWLRVRWSVTESEFPVPSTECESLHDDVEDAFAEWMLKHFATLHNRSFAQRPVMLHHVPHHIAHSREADASAARGRNAVVVVDGLAVDQWVLLRDALREQVGDALVVEDGVIFAWVPTLTAVSRQSIFAGEPPLFFRSSIGSTHREPKHWQRFWEERGLRREEVGYVCQKKQEPDDAYLERVFAVSEHPKMRSLGVVVGTVDQSLHGVVTGSRGLHSIVRDWAQQGAFARLMDGLTADGYEVHVTADHGNVLGRGIGKPNVGATADERGERAHVFPDDRTRGQVQAEYPETISWPGVGLPDDYKALLAGGRGAFIAKGKATIGHGGIALEEVVVPFVRITRRQP